MIYTNKWVELEVAVNGILFFLIASLCSMKYQARSSAKSRVAS